MSKDSSLQEIQFGEKGVVHLKDDVLTSDTINFFSVISAVTDCTISIGKISNSEPIVNISLQAGFQIAGYLSQVSISEGEVLCYKR